MNIFMRVHKKNARNKEKREPFPSFLNPTRALHLSDMQIDIERTFAISYYINYCHCQASPSQSAPLSQSTMYVYFLVFL